MRVLRQGLQVLQQSVRAPSFTYRGTTVQMPSLLSPMFAVEQVEEAHESTSTPVGWFGVVGKRLLSSRYRQRKQVLLRLHANLCALSPLLNESLIGCITLFGSI